jgi:hypothetical protein
MSQRKKVNNPANNYSLKDQFLQQTGRPVPAPQASENREPPMEKSVPQKNVSSKRIQSEKEEPKCYEWERWTIILSKDMKRKIMAIADKERFSIRDIIEKFLGDGIDAYEVKHGKVKTRPRKKKSVDSLL